MKRVALIAATRDGMLLMGKRRDNGKWTMPGGSVNEGESPEDGARRELKEETDLEPVGELKLYQKREHNGVEFYIYQCKVDGTPSGKNDPDNECGVWGFFDIENGIPKDVNQNMAGPKGDENVLADMYGLEKMMPGPRFPKMGFPDDRRETPIISTSLELDNKARLMAERQVARVESQIPESERDPERRRLTAEHYTKENKEPAGQVLTTGTSIGFAKDPKLRQHLNPLSDLVNHTDMAGPATREHENFHFMMNRVQEKHGPQARYLLARNLYHRLDPMHKAAVAAFAATRNPGMGMKHPLYHEEALAVMLNYLNSPGEREAFHKYIGHTPERAREFQTSMKSAHRELLRHAADADHTWATEPKPWNKIDYQIPAEAFKQPSAKKPRAKKPQTTLPGIEKAEVHDLAKMAIADIPPGKKIADEFHEDPDYAGQVFDYTHVLPPDYQGHYHIKVLHRPNTKGTSTLRASFHSNRDPSYTLGSVIAFKRKGGIEPHARELHSNYRGKGIGRALYEAMYAHAFHNGVREVHGGIHTDEASRVHQSLARRHGLEGYKKVVSDPDDMYPNEDYSYALKQELSMSKREEDDEVDRMLMHPSIAERRMALKLGTVRDKHLIRALEDEDPEVQRAAFSHPAMSSNVLHALMRMPNREHLQLMALGHPLAGIDHVRALYEQNRHNGSKRILHAITNHADLDPGLIRDMYDDGNATRGLIANLRTPADLVQQIIEAHLNGDPSHRHLAMEALKHPHAPSHLVEEALKFGRDDGTRLAAANSANLPPSAAEDVLKQGHLPTNNGDAFVRFALVTSPHASPRHLEMGLDDMHPRVRAGVFATKSPHLNASHIDKAIDKGDPILIGFAMNHPLRTDEHTKKLASHPRKEVRQLADLYSPQNQQALKKFEGELEAWLKTNELQKATAPVHFAGIVHMSDPEGRKLVDHTPHLEAHPPEHSHHVQAYREHILNSPQLMKPVPVKRNGGAEGITRKRIYEIPHTVQTHGGQRYMVKPYHERIPRRFHNWSRHPHQGWAEMAHQALYHAAGIGDLHQKVHVSEHNMGVDLPKEPALSIAIDKDVSPLFEHDHSIRHYADAMPELRDQARKIAVMDFLTNNLDRHGANLMVKWKKDGSGAPDKLMAIDHSRSFQYLRSPRMQWNRSKSATLDQQDRFGDYVNSAAIHSIIPMQRTNPQRLQEEYGPTFDWWAHHSPQVRETMYKQLEQIKDPSVRNHIRRNFDERAKWLDERAEFGIENYGDDWHADGVPIYQPHEMTDQEKYLTDLLERTTDPEGRAVLLQKLGRKE